MSIDVIPTTILAPFEAEHEAVSISRTNKGSRWDRIGNNELISANEWRYSYDPLTGVPSLRAIMGQWTNEMFDWSDFSQTSWAKESGVTVGTDTGIRGETKNIKLTPDGTNNGRIRQDKTVPDDSNTHTVQVWLKKNMSSNAKVEAVLSGGTTGVTADVVVNTNDGSVVSGSATVTDAGDTYEVSFQITNNSTGNTTLSERYYPDNSAQTTAQTFDVTSLFKNRSSPPPTPVYGEVAGQSYTQDPDIATVTDLDAINFNPSEGTFVVEVIPNTDNNDIYWALSATDGTSDNIMGIRRSAATGGNYSIALREGFNTFNEIDIGQPSSGIDRIAYAYDVSGVYGCLNGGQVFSISDEIPTNIDRINLGHLNGNTFWDGFKTSDLYYPRRLSNAQLQQLTS